MRKTKSLSALILALVMVIGLFPTTVFAYSASGDSLVPTNKVSDIYINAQTGSGYDAAEISDKVSAGLVNAGVDANDFRIVTNVTDIDTLDTSGWYVYDHYDTEYWDTQIDGTNTTRDAAWENYYGKTTTTDVMRPATYYTEYNYSSADDNNTTKSDNPTTICEW